MGTRPIAASFITVCPAIELVRRNAVSLQQIDVQFCSHWGGDREAAYAVWASSMDKGKAEAKTNVDVARVVIGLVHLHHDTPKERLWMEFFITCPIFVERQFDKY